MTAGTRAKLEQLIAKAQHGKAGPGEDWLAVSEVLEVLAAEPETVSVQGWKECLADLQEEHACLMARAYRIEKLIPRVKDEIQHHANWRRDDEAEGAI